MSYLTELPSPDEIREGLQFAYEYWQPRNRFINDVRTMLSGNNKIEVPANTSYKIRTLHTYTLAAILNEKAARFTALPTIQVIPQDETPEARVNSSQLEQALNVAMSEMERRSDGDVWSRVVADALYLDEGVERIECAPAAFWPEVVDLLHSSIDSPFERELTHAMSNKKKKELGIPIRSVYIPLENCFPIYEGPTVVENYEVEVRRLRDVMRNPLFADARTSLGSYQPDTRTGLNTKVTIVHYTNAKFHAYYALVPNTSINDNSLSWPDLTTLGVLNVGTPIDLHSYEHNTGQVIYNFVPGRFGGWKSTTNRIEGVGKGLLELSQGKDEVVSQVFTNIRAKYWPTLLQKVDPDQRGYEVGGTEPKKLTVQEGQDLVIYANESVEPLFQPVDDPMVGWFLDLVDNQISRLAGGGSLYGERSPGVDTGYHQALQITQSEQLDEKIEQHLSSAAVNRVSLILKHIKAMDMGEVFVNTTDTVAGRKVGRYYSINPSNLTPLPRMDAQVRKPRPVDYAASLRAANEASSEREGKGPILSDDTIMADILNIQAPDIEKHKVRVEHEINNIINSGILNQRIMEALNIKLAVADVPGNVDLSSAAPALQQAAGQQNTSRQGQNQPPSQPGDRSTGMPTGGSQPESVDGMAIAAAMRGG